MILVSKKIKKKDNRASITMLFRFDDAEARATVLVSASGGIGILAHGNVEWEPMLEAVYTSVDEVLILNS